MKKTVSLVLKLFVSIAILFVLFKLVPYRELIEVYKKADKTYIFLSFLIYVLTFVISIFRWKFLLNSLGVKVRSRDAFYSTFSGLFFNLIFPSFVAGDIFRGFSISTHHGEAKKVASSVLMDRFSGAIALLLVAFFSYIFGRRFFREAEVALSLFILCLLLGVVSCVIFSKTVFSFLIKILGNRQNLKNKITEFHDHLYFFRKNPSVFFKSMYFSMPIQLLTPIMFFVGSKAFGLHVSMLYFFILVPIIMMIALIPITIAGAGTREAASVYFFSLINVGKAVGLGLSLLNLAFTIFAGLLGGLFYVTVYHRRLQSRP
ncbi:MAG: lysylphosphatidylglycerol synthase transmembrane domain-containing protein [Candidatus Omnitrophica bacterium]|nr:lysylphosphatidylglycerol synthase transmembrane domain-containing protein [Candidatus Omnitrophota bacterium]